MDLNTRSLDWESSTLTTRPLVHKVMKEISKTMQGTLVNLEILGHFMDSALFRKSHQRLSPPSASQIVKESFHAACLKLGFRKR